MMGDDGVRVKNQSGRGATTLVLTHMAVIPKVLSVRGWKHMIFCQHASPSSLFMISIMTKPIIENEHLLWCLFISQPNNKSNMKIPLSRVKSNIMSLT